MFPRMLLLKREEEEPMGPRLAWGMDYVMISGFDGAEAGLGNGLWFWISMGPRLAWGVH